MKFKFTWGTGILLTIIIFVSFFIGFIIFSLTRDINLVSKDYFPDEIAYDVKINKIKNTNALKEKVQFKISNNILKITFPSFIADKEKLKGQVNFYYIKSYRGDISVKIEIDQENRQFIDISKFAKGRYTVQLDWSYDKKDYYQEHIIEIK